LEQPDFEEEKKVLKRKTVEVYHDGFGENWACVYGA